MTGRCHYSGLTVRGTGPDTTAIRLSVLATLLTNRHLSVLDYKNMHRWQSGPMRGIANPKNREFKSHPVFQGLNTSMNKDTFCPMPWIGTSIGNAGQLTPCCAYDEGAVSAPDNQWTSPENQSNHIKNFRTWKISNLDSVRQELLNGVRHSENNI